MKMIVQMDMTASYYLIYYMVNSYNYSIKLLGIMLFKGQILLSPLFA